MSALAIVTLQRLRFDDAWYVVVTAHSGALLGIQIVESDAATESFGRREVERSVRLRPGGLEQVVALTFPDVPLACTPTQRRNGSVAQ